MALSTKVLSEVGRPAPEKVEPTSRKDRARMLAAALDSAKTLDERTSVIEALLELRAEV